ncbi:MAG: hypothetical protein ACJ74J_06545 [Blastocatellia bacterium]
MRKGVLWVGVALMLVAPFVITSAQQGPSSVEPLRAKIVIENTNPNEAATTESGQFYRDSQGRTRLEVGGHIIINDPVARARYVLDTEQRVAHKMPMPSGGPRERGPGDGMMPPPPPPPPGANGTAPDRLMPPPPPPRPDGPPPQRTDLGTRQIEGLTAHGWEITRPLPPLPDGESHNVAETTQTWVAEELKLPLLIETVVSDGHRHTRRFTEIQRNAAVDASLFAVPADYQIVAAPPPPPPPPPRRP